MAQFVDGLQERIARKVERHPYHQLHELLHLTIQVEQQIKRMSSIKPRATQPWVPNSTKPQDRAKSLELNSRFKGKAFETSKATRPEPKNFQNNP